MAGVAERVNKERAASSEVSLKDAFYFHKEWGEDVQTHYLYCPQAIGKQVQDALRGQDVKFSAITVKEVEVIRLHKDSATEELISQFSVLESEEGRINKLNEITQAAEPNLQK